MQLRIFLPRVFARKPRALDDVDRFKATEFRQFLLYTGKIVLRRILPDSLYCHFLCLNVALAILLSPSLLQKHSDYASSLLVYFVEKGCQLYTKEFLVYNVHSLLHLVDVACRYQGLDNCSAFCFENYLHKLKRKVRSGFKPLVQMVNRLSEESEVKMTESNFNVMCSSVTRPDNAYILSTNSCCEVIDVTSEENHFLCRVYEHGQPYFTNPCDSRLIGTMVVHRRNSRIKVLPNTMLTNKAFLLDVSNKVIVQALLHSLTT